MRLDHLLSKEELWKRSKDCISVKLSTDWLRKDIKSKYWSGGDARRGHTRTHPEHDGEDLYGRWYYIGDDMGEQEAAGPYLITLLVMRAHEQKLVCCDGR